MTFLSTGYRRTARWPLVLALALPLAACENLGSTLGDTLGSNEALGGLGSGIACAALSKLTGGNDRQIAASAVVCAAVGYGVTKAMEDRRKEFATNEQFYAAESKRLRDYEVQLTEQIRVAKADLAADQMRAAGLIDAAERSNVQRSELQLIQAEFERRERFLGLQLETAQQNREYQRGLVLHMQETQGSTPQGESEQLAKLERSVAELESILGEHAVQTASLGAYL